MQPNPNSITRRQRQSHPLLDRLIQIPPLNPIKPLQELDNHKARLIERGR